MEMFLTVLLWVFFAVLTCTIIAAIVVVWYFATQKQCPECGDMHHGEVCECPRLWK